MRRSEKFVFFERQFNYLTFDFHFIFDRLKYDETEVAEKLDRIEFQNTP